MNDPSQISKIYMLPALGNEFNSAINLVSKVGESFFNIGHYDKTDRPVIIGKKKGLAFAKGSEELKRCWK